MQKESPFFSVIVPVYNNENDLEKCIFSILTQSCTDFELILVDDASVDKSPQMCDWFADRDSRVEVIHRKMNGGVAAARNDGLFHASGKFICHVDGDDWVDRGLLEEARQKLDQEGAPDIFVFCYTRVQECEKGEKRALCIQEGFYDKERLKREVYPAMICKVGKKLKAGIDSGSLCDKIIRRELLKKHYCRDTTLFRGEDSVCSWECLYYSNSIYFSNLSMYFYNRMNRNSSTKKYHADLYENNKAVVKYLRVHLKAEDDFQIERQISALEYRSMVGVIHQEIDYRHPIYASACFLKAKCKKGEDICLGNGIWPFNMRLYILLINRRCFVLLLLCTIFKYSLGAVVHFFKRSVQ